MLADLRRSVVDRAGVDLPDLAKLARVRLRTIAMAIGTLVALFALLSRIGDPETFWQTIRDATWGWVVLALVAALLTNVAFAIAFLGTVPIRFDFWPVVWLQTAMGFSNVALPSGAESAVQVRFLQKHGLDLASALAVGGVLSTISEFVVQLALFGIAVLLAPSKVDIGDVPVGSMAAVIAVAVLAVGVVLAVVFGVRRIRRRVLPHVQRGGADDLGRDPQPGPHRAARGRQRRGPTPLHRRAAGLPHVFGASASFWTLLALNIGISTIAGLVPIPGGDTAVSTIGMSGALVAIGVPESAAAAAVLVNRWSRGTSRRSPGGSRPTTSCAPASSDPGQGDVRLVHVPPTAPSRASGRSGRGRASRTGRSAGASSWTRVRISANAMWSPPALSSWSSWASISAAVTSMSVIASHCSTTHARLVARGRASGPARRNAPALAKNSGASQR